MKDISLKFFVIAKRGYVHSYRDRNQTRKCLSHNFNLLGFPGGSDGKESAYGVGRPAFDPLVRKIPWRREWTPTPVFWPGELHEQKSLASYSPWSCIESDTTERINLSNFF